MGTPMTGSSDLAAMTPARCAALSRPGDDHREPLIRGPGSELQRLVGGLVGGQHPDLTGDPERLEGLGGLLHDRPVGPRPQDDCDFVTHERATLTDSLLMTFSTNRLSSNICSPWSHCNRHCSVRASRFRIPGSPVWSESDLRSRVLARLCPGLPGGRRPALRRADRDRPMASTRSPHVRPLGQDAAPSRERPADAHPVIPEMIELLSGHYQVPPGSRERRLVSNRPRLGGMARRPCRPRPGSIHRRHGLPGGPRRFLIRPRGGGESTGFDLGRGDLVVMGGACQRLWEHTVSKSASAPPRIALMFRHRYD